MVSQQVCVNCGTSVGGEDIYCAVCGTELSAASRVIDGGAVSGEFSLDQHTELAGIWRRAGSILLDSVLIALILKILTALGLLLLFLRFPELLDAPSQLVMGAGLLSLLLLYLGVPAGYYLYFWGTSGRTPGKRMLGLRVVQMDGAQVSLRTATLRVVGYYISGFVFGLGFIGAAFDPKRQGWHDKFAYTRVVQTKKVGAIRIILASILLVIVGTISIPAVLIGVAMQNFRMEGSSMVPAYESGQYILVNKLVYKFDDPQQGDVIVFRFPKDPSRLFAKRIIGLPGDTVAISDGTVFVNGKPLEEPYLAVRDSSDMALRHLGEREYFVLGDNRRGSNDSRNWGPVPEENIVGKMWITYYGPQD